jgi:geranylgeranyl diphosphate synthase type I
MADFRTYLAGQRRRIAAYLDARLPELCEDLSLANPWRFPLCAQLLEYTKSGKMVRGCLVAATHRLFADQDDERVVGVGALMELIQSFLLIHDDMMDGDETRRGLAAIHARYRDLGMKEETPDAGHFGNSMAVCVGDVAYLLSMRVLADIEFPADTTRRLLRVVSREVSLVGVAQMTDLYQGVTRNPVEPEHIKNLYVHKTGRYTFSLPMSLGAIVAEAPDSAIDKLSQAGELLGFVFQLKDDELGVFADQADLGKPVGSDIEANKKTLLRHRLYRDAGESERGRLDGIFGSSPVGVEDLRYVRNLIERLGIRAQLQDEMRTISDEAMSIMGSIDPHVDIGVFSELARYNLDRTE